LARAQERLAVLGPHIVTPLLDETGKPRGFSEITHDITERKRAEEDLHSYADRLKSPPGAWSRSGSVQALARACTDLDLDQAPGGDFQAVGVAVEILLGALALGDVVSDLGEAARFSVSSSSGVTICGPELRAVLAHAPTSLS